MLKPKRKHLKKTKDVFSERRKAVFGFIMIAMGILIAQALYLQVFNKQFLQQEGRKRYIKNVGVAAYRGRIQDRNGESLAVSAPVETISVNPQYCFLKKDQDAKRICLALIENKLDALAQLLERPVDKLKKSFDAASKKYFVYLRRRAEPALASNIRALGVPGVGFSREFKRYYPTGEVSAHLLGFTNIDDRGQEGLELMYNDMLTGIVGSKRVIRDGEKNIIEEIDVESIKEPEAGQDLILSIDERLQYLAYRELKAGVIRHQAKAATLVILEAETGNVLAIVNQPSFNPNKSKGLKRSHHRNRAIINAFEPGSTLKPLAVAAALEGGFVNEGQKFITKPMRIKRNWVRDGHDYGELNLGNILKKSSNVGVSKVALSMPPEYFWRFYNAIGFGRSLGVGFPSETSGSLKEYFSWNKFDQATLSFGYGISMSVLQLARAYTILADDGMLHSVSLLKREKDEYATRILSSEVAIKVRTMIEEVVKKGGTATKASVSGYRVAGKTGTVKKSVRGGYGNDYLSVFVGMAPASDPKLIIAVMVDAPQAGQYYGGLVAAPIFSKVMEGALRILKVPPDDESSMSTILIKE